MPKPVDLAAALAAESVSHAQAMTFAELAEAYFARNPVAEGGYRLRKWLPAFGHMDAWSVPAEDLERAAEAMVAAGYAPGSVNRDIGIFGSIYRWARRKRITPRGFISPTLAIRRYNEALRARALVSRSRGFG